MLIALPEDIILDIIYYLGVHDVLTLRKTCRALHSFGGNDYVWHRLISEFPLPIDLPFNTVPCALPGDELQRLAIKAIRLNTNWGRPAPRVRTLRPVIKHESNDFVDRMQFLPGGKWLWTAERTLKRESWHTRMSVWSVEEVDPPSRVWSTEMSGIFRACAMVQSDDGATATLVVGVCDHREVIEVHTVSLEELSTVQYGIYPVYSIPTPCKPKQIHIVSHPRAPHLRPIIHEIACLDNLLVVTVFALDTGGGAGSLQILFVNPKTGATKWADPQFAQPFSFLWVRVWGDFLFLVGEVESNFAVRVYRLPQPFASASASPRRTPPPSPESPSTSDEEEDHYAYTDLGPMVSQYTGPKHMTFPGHHIAQISPSNSPSSLSAVMFYHSVHPHSAKLLRFSFDVSQEAVSLSETSCKEFPMGDESSAQLAQVGSLGTRAVWLEHSWESQQNRVMKLSYDPRTGVANVGVLLCQMRDSLPFSPDKCHSLAFDEATCRLCVGMYNGPVYVLDFV